jgi:hypothetical protein
MYRYHISSIQVAFSSNDFNIHAVGDRLNKLGWNLNALQLPDA